MIRFGIQSWIVLKQHTFQGLFHRVRWFVSRSVIGLPAPSSSKFATAEEWEDPFTIAQWLKTSIAKSAAK